MSRYTNQGAPDYHITSAQSHTANHSVTRRPHVRVDLERENASRSFRNGLIVGFSIAAIAFSLVLWLWVIPTMDGAVAMAQGMVA